MIGKKIKHVIIFTFFGLSAAHAAALGDTEKTTSPSVPNEHVGWVLERLNVDRIKGYAASYQKQLKRSDFNQKVLLFSGGAIAVGGLAWLCKKFFAVAPEQAQEVVSIPPGPEISDQEYRRAMLALKSEIARDNRDSLSFWGGIKQGVNDGAAVAFYSFIGSIVLAALSSTWKNAGHGFARSLGLFSSKEQTEEHEQLVSMVGKTLGEVIPEYEQACLHALDLGVENAASLAFVSFLEREIVKQHAAFIQAIEETIAFLSELQQHRSREDKVLMQSFDEQVVAFWGVLDSYAEALEHMLNASLDKNKSVLCKKVSLISKQIYYQTDRFVEGCKNLAMEA